MSVIVVELCIRCYRMLNYLSLNCEQVAVGHCRFCAQAIVLVIVTYSLVDVRVTHKDQECSMFYIYLRMEINTRYKK